MSSADLTDLAFSMTEKPPYSEMRVALITALRADGKVCTDQTGTAWLARDQDTRLRLDDRVYLVRQGSTFLVAGRLSGIRSEPWVKRKTTTQNVTASATLVNDTDLLAVLAPGDYRISLVVHYSSSAALADISSAWSFSGSVSTGGRSCIGPGSVTTAVDGSTTSSIMRSSGHGLGTTVVYGTDAGLTTGVLQEDLLITAVTTGTLQWMWAQGASNPNATNVSGASRLYITPLLLVP